MNTQVIHFLLKKIIICLVKFPGNFITELQCMNIFQAYNILPKDMNRKCREAECMWQMGMLEVQLSSNKQ